MKMVKFIDHYGDPACVNPTAIVAIDVIHPSEDISEVRIFTAAGPTTLLHEAYTVDGVVKALGVEVEEQTCVLPASEAPAKPSTAVTSLVVIIEPNNSCDNICRLISVLPDWMKDADDDWIKLASQIVVNYKKNTPLRLSFEKERGERFINLLNDMHIIHTIKE